MNSRRLSVLGGLLLAAAPAILCLAALVLRPQAWGPRQQTDQAARSVYAYRQWQSLGIEVAPEDVITIRARGEWQYSPYVGLHGPAGAGWPVTVRTYPLGEADGGVLIGRIGEAGAPFYVGAGTVVRADAAGLLYFRINDDLLGDNKGALDLEITVARAAASR